MFLQKYFNNHWRTHIAEVPEVEENTYLKIFILEKSLVTSYQYLYIFTDTILERGTSIRLVSSIRIVCHHNIYRYLADGY